MLESLRWPLGQKRSTSLLREKSDLERRRDAFNTLLDGLEEADTLFELGEEENDAELFKEAREAYRALEDLVSQAEVRRMLSGDMDTNDAILEI